MRKVPPVRAWTTSWSRYQNSASAGRFLSKTPAYHHVDVGDGLIGGRHGDKAVARLNPKHPRRLKGHEGPLPRAARPAKVDGRSVGDQPPGAREIRSSSRGTKAKKVRASSRPARSSSPGLARKEGGGASDS